MGNNGNVRTSTRYEDEILLEMLHWRSRGHHTTAIAAFMGLSASYVRSATNKFKKALISEGLGEFTEEAFW
jgi:hypothetical protein